MTRINIICEGQTEEQFVKELLAPHFAAFNIWVTPQLIGRPGHKGGNFKIERLITDLRAHLQQDRSAYCTTFFDFYGLPQSFPGKDEAQTQGTIDLKSQILLTALTERLQTVFDRQTLQRFIPYVQMYEFEALLFSDPAKMSHGMYKPELEGAFTTIVNQFPTPEAINNSPQTAPSKRIKSLIPGYEKPLMGALTALEIGLDKMREQCQLFNGWLSQIEALATENVYP